MLSAFLYLAAILIPVPPVVDHTCMPDSIPSEYRFLYQENTSSDRPNLDVVRSELPYVKIEYEANNFYFEEKEGSHCLFEHGRWAKRTVSFSCEGPATFVGKDENREGHFRSEISTFLFARLCYALDESGFFEMKRRYSSPYTHGITKTISVVGRNGERYSVSEYGSYGPPTFWTLTHTIEWIVEKTQWERDGG